MITLSATITKDDGSQININNRNVVSIETTVSDRKDITKPNWGIVSNNGRISFIDVDGSIKNMAETHSLSSGLKVEVFVKHPLGVKDGIIQEAEEKICELETDTWEYDNENKNVAVSVTDGLEALQDIPINKSYNYDFVARNVMLESIYDTLRNATPAKFNFLSRTELDEQTQTMLASQKLNFYASDADNLWAAWNELAEACFSHIYKHKGKTLFVYKGGD